MKIHAQIGHGKLVFSTPQSEAKFFENEGKDVTIEIDDGPVKQIRRYLRVCIRYYFYQHPSAGWEDDNDCWYDWKRTHGYAEVRHDRLGRRETVAISTQGWRRGPLQRITEALVEDMMRNGLEVPDSDAYKHWEASAPAKDDVYPPLQSLKKTYEEQRAEGRPWRKPVPGRSGEQSEGRI